jgi:hypothetical protein
MTSQDFSIIAKIKTEHDGTIFSLSDGGDNWVPDGQAWFIRGGRLVFDIGWVGAVSGRTNVSDGRWHTVALTWEQATRQVRLYVDGRLDGEGTLAAKGPLPQPVARIGFTSPNFPQPASFFQGEIAQVQFHNRRLTEGLQTLPRVNDNDDRSTTATAAWDLAAQLGVYIAIENVWNHFLYDHAGPLVTQTADKYVRYVDELNSPWVGMQFDIGNHWKYGSMGDWIRQLGRRVVKLDLKGFSRANDQFTKITEGDIDWLDVRRALLEINYGMFRDICRAQIQDSLENGDAIGDMRALYGDFMRALSHTLGEFEAPAGTLEEITA